MQCIHYVDTSSVNKQIQQLLTLHVSNYTILPVHAGGFSNPGEQMTLTVGGSPKIVLTC